MNVRKIKTLLVDDHPDFLGFAARYLSQDEAIAISGTALSGPEALELAKKLDPDLVLADLAMPGMNGLEVTRILKGRPNPPCVIILTMYDNAEYMDAARKAGADGFVTKAELDTRLLKVIHDLLAEKKPMKNILVVDDSKTMRKMVAASLGRLKGASIREAASGLEAIEQLALTPIHLMTLDLNMPDMHGMEVIRFVRSHDRYRKIPIMVLTTKTDAATRESALQAGATVYISKPFDPVVLAQNAEELLTGERSSP
ncbi:MAG TPA: response regulator [Smithellaceae bacterium]|nr:response regulator [Smithellaceae bacterium]HRS83049.1 response regulator [Smithellaceae bacterium]HRV44998.1 response regulator [Smithellaceae bacterium]